MVVFQGPNPALEALLKKTREQFKLGNRKGTTLFGSPDVTPDLRIGPQYYATVRPQDVVAINRNFDQIAKIFQTQADSQPLKTMQTDSSREQEKNTPGALDTLGAGFNQISQMLGPTGLLIGGAVLLLLLIKK